VRRACEQHDAAWVPGYPGGSSVILTLRLFFLEALMSNRWLRALLFSAPFAVGCGVLPDVKLGADAGVPPISGSTTISIPQDYKCGDPIKDPNGKYTVTSKGDAESCTFTFKQDVKALTADDYDNNPQLEGARVVNGIAIDVKKFDVKDAATGKRPGGLKDLTGKAFGETILTKEDLDKAPPYTKEIEGPAIDSLKSQVEAKQDIIIPVDVVVIVALTPAPPEKLQLEFDAQPNLVIGF
jgi:hypothetical protein